MSARRQPHAEAVDELPRLAPGESFQFACHPGVPCFNACCRDLDLLLNPSDVLRLRRRLGLSSRQLFDRLLDPLELPGTGFPAAALRMADAPGRPCPFVASRGCTVYEDRPAACRTYPLGRGTGLSPSGEVVERWCLVREPHCRGFEEDRSWTTRAWVADQGIEEYAAVDDRYLLLVARAARAGLCLAEGARRKVGVAMYRLDRFGELLRGGEPFDRLAVSPERREAILGDERQRLVFAFDWLEVMLFS